MREIRLSGSEGGGTVNPSFLPLSLGPLPHGRGSERTLADKLPVAPRQNCHGP